MSRKKRADPAARCVLDLVELFLAEGAGCPGRWVPASSLYTDFLRSGGSLGVSRTTFGRCLSLLGAKRLHREDGSYYWMPVRGLAMRRRTGPTEASEQAVVVRLLGKTRARFFAVPNGGKRAGKEGVSLRVQGVKPGVSDLLIVDRPPSMPYLLGTALEMKRTNGVPEDVTPEQLQWLADFKARRWHVLVGWGADDALEKLRRAGYPVAVPPRPDRGEDPRDVEVWARLPAPRVAEWAQDAPGGQKRPTDGPTGLLGRLRAAQRLSGAAG